MYALRGGFLVRPLVIAAAIGLLGAVFSSLEEAIPAVSAWVPRTLFPSHADPQVAQIILGGIAASIMTVVSIVFAILLMTLTLASMQFSPRILVSFVRDRVTQWTLGIFLGTFAYCMTALPAARFLPQPFSPVATVTGAMMLALICVAWLLFFIHHISEAISVNHIVDRIARETEEVINDIMPYPQNFAYRAEPIPIDVKENESPALNQLAGYIRYIDTNRLLQLASGYKVRIEIFRRIGHFVPAGVRLFTVLGRDQLSSARVDELRRAFGIGPTRTMQQDAEFGVIQIVDIALKAISPAVNDPSTAISCIDQLSRILIYWLRRKPPESQLCNPPHVVRVVVPWIGTDGMLDTAFEQIRHYSTSDAAVSLRLLRALEDIASAVDDSKTRAKLFARGQRIVAGCIDRVDPADLAKLRQRLGALEGLSAETGTAPGPNECGRS